MQQFFNQACLLPMGQTMAGLLSGYCGALTDAESKTRYVDNKLVNGMDPYELGRTDHGKTMLIFVQLLRMYMCACT